MLQTSKIRAAFLDILKYIHLIASKWVLWVFFVLDLIALATQLLYAPFRLPQSTFLLILIVGLVWASYQVYRDIASKLPSFPREPPPYEVLPLSFNITSAAEIPYIEFSLYIVNHQPRDLVVQSAEITNLYLSGGPQLDPIPYTGDKRVEPRFSARLSFRRQLSTAEVNAIKRTQYRNPVNASFNVAVRALVGHRHLNQDTVQLSANGWLDRPNSSSQPSN